MVGKNSAIAVYIMTDKPRGTLYIGVTSSFLSRIVQQGFHEGFTKSYGLKRLVWFEPRESMIGAIQREKSLKRWPREWKINLIERDNPHSIQRSPTGRRFRDSSDGLVRRTEGS